MSQNIEEKDVEHLLAEADELMRQINAAALMDREEALSLQFETHAQNLDKMKSAVLRKKEKKKNSGAEGMHAAILDIIKALGNLRKELS